MIQGKHTPLEQQTCNTSSKSYISQAIHLSHISTSNQWHHQLHQYQQCYTVMMFCATAMHILCVWVCKVCSTVCVLCFASCDYDVCVCQCVCVSDCMCVCMWMCVCLLMLFDCICTCCNVLIDWLKPSVWCCSPPSYTTMDPTLGSVSQQLQELTDGFMKEADPVLQGWDATLCVDSVFGL